MTRCGECGNKSLELRSAKGTFFPFKDHIKIPLLYDLNVMTCTKCCNQIFSNVDLVELNILLERSIKTLCRKSIEEISKDDIRQIDVARMVGQTPEYISNLKSGSKIPSSATLSLVRIFSKYPAIMEEFTGFKRNVTLTPVMEIRRIIRKDETLFVDHSEKKVNDLRMRKQPGADATRSYDTTFKLPTFNKSSKVTAYSRPIKGH